MKKLYVSDLDQTLLSSDGEVSDETLQGLKILQTEGVCFTVASARHVISIKKALKGHVFSLPVIASNGATLSDLQNLQHKFINGIKSDIIDKIIEYGHTLNLEACFSVISEEKDKLYISKCINKGIEWYIGDRVKNNDSRLCEGIYQYNQASDDKVIAVSFIDTFEKLNQLYSVISGDEYVKHNVTIYFFENRYSPNWFWLTVQSSQAKKHIALKDLIDKKGLQDYEVIVFGDDENDSGLFEFAARSYAVSNAVEGLKKRATNVIGHHNENSVIKFILNDVKK